MVSKPTKARGAEYNGARLPHGPGSGEPSTRAINSPQEWGHQEIRLFGIERQRDRARSRLLESGRAAQALPRPRSSGRLNRVRQRARLPLRASPKNGDISHIRSDRRIGCQPRMHGARGKTIGDINGRKREEQRCRTSRVTCIAGASAGNADAHPRDRRAHQIRRLTARARQRGGRRPRAIIATS